MSFVFISLTSILKETWRHDLLYIIASRDFCDNVFLVIIKCLVFTVISVSFTRTRILLGINF